MSKLEQLIEELCPDGVEQVQLNTVIDYEQPTKYIVGDTNYNNEFDIPVLTAGQSFILGYTDEIDGIYVADKENATIIFDDFTTSFHWVDFNFKIKSSAMKMLRVKTEKNSDVLLRYVYHCMKNMKYEPVDHSRQWIAKYSIFSIPLPPLEIQREIVRILDTFTELTAELTAELTDRKKQYEYYIENLLNSSGDITMETVGDIFSTVTDYVAAGSFASIAENVSYKNDPDFAQLVRTMDIKSAFTKGNNVYVDKTAFDFLWRVNLDKESIIMPNIGVNCGEVYYVKPEQLPYENNVLGPNAILLRSDRYNNKYLYYLLTTHLFQKALKVIISPGGQTKFNKTGLKNLKLPIPYADNLEKSLAEQERIVGLLDRFDTLCNDISKGLPAEIESRQQQYEYYRDKLLTFKNINAEV